MVSDKGCLATPRSPVSTAGNSTPRREESFDFSSSLVRGELKDEVLISSNISWDSPLTSPKEIASLSRAIADSNSILRLAPSPIGCRISWRLFQAADRTYNGFVTPADLHRVLLSVYPSSLRMHADSIPLDPADATPLLLWDVLVLWRDMDVAAGSRQIIEHNILNNLVVPSDGLWAGVGLSATIRVWKNICRSAGYQFRFCAENYLHAAFRSVQSQGLAKTETLLSELEVVFFLINECLTRINASAAQLWRNFATLDISDLGHLDQLRFDHLVRITPHPLISNQPTFQSRSASLDLPLDAPTYPFVQVLDVSVRASVSDASKHVGIFPGQRNPNKGFISFFKNLVLKSEKSNGPPMIRAKAVNSDTQLSLLLKTYVKQYLDIEQWRGQYVSELNKRRHRN